MSPERKKYVIQPGTLIVMSERVRFIWASNTTRVITDGQWRQAVGMSRLQQKKFLDLQIMRALPEAHAWAAAEIQRDLNKKEENNIQREDKEIRKLTGK